MLDLFTTDQQNLLDQASRSPIPSQGTTAGEAFGAAYDANLRGTSALAEGLNTYDVVQDHLDGFRARTGETIPNPIGQEFLDASQPTLDDVRQRFAAKARELNDPALVLPSDDDLHQATVARARATLTRQEQLAQGPQAFGAGLARFAGSAAADTANPLNAVAIATIPEGGLAAKMLGAAAGFGGTTLANDLLGYGFHQQVDPSFGPGAVVRDTVEAAATGAGFEAAGPALGAVARFTGLDNLPGVLWRRIKGTEPALADAMPTAVADAGNVAERVADLQANNPFPGPAGEAAHNAALVSVERDMLAGRTPELPTPDLNAGQPITATMPSLGALGDRTVTAQMHAPAIAGTFGADIPGTLVSVLDRPDGGMSDGLVAYHGTPHDFDAFDLSRVGTGEGAQAYGHGLYFAESQKIAEWYRDTLSGSTFKPDITLDGAPLPQTNGLDVKADPVGWAADKLAETGYDAKKAIASLSRSKHPNAKEAAGLIRSGRMQVVPYAGKDPQFDPAHPLYGSRLAIANRVADDMVTAGSIAPDEAADYASVIHGHHMGGHRFTGSDAFGQDEFGPVAAEMNQRAGAAFDHLDLPKPYLPQPMLYRVSIAAKREHLLDYDKPLAEQPSTVRAALARLVPGADEATTGKQAYRALRDAVGSPEAASQALREAGVKGISYFDAASRRPGGKGTRNIVVFDDRDLRVTHKNGIEVARQANLPDTLRGDVDAAFAEAYPSEETRRLAQGLADASPSWSAMRDAAAGGLIPLTHDITAAVADAARVVAQARAEGRSAAEVFNAGDAFHSETAQMASRLFVKDDGSLLSRSQIAGNLRDLADGLRGVDRPDSGRAPAPIDPELRGAIREATRPEAVAAAGKAPQTAMAAEAGLQRSIEQGRSQVPVVDDEGNVSLGDAAAELQALNDELTAAKAIGACNVPAGGVSP